ncbi:hypothetical protein NDU88_001594 [Pleurodeles waltl]|uniref:Uncharacterized protein n=1 Tax=Pleurodeles waltl TaxID=8319 RepID=A0AAV7MK69_PLEWA|nr:hypothetical protein NDU88_001594 [Pleurodeles waltl]
MLCHTSNRGSTSILGRSHANPKEMAPGAAPPPRSTRQPPLQSPLRPVASPHQKTAPGHTSSRSRQDRCWIKVPAWQSLTERWPFAGRPSHAHRA